MKICVECGKSFNDTYRNANSKYCDDNCRAKVRSKVQKKGRKLKKERAKNDLDFCSMEAFKKYRHRSPLRNLEFSLSSKDFRDNIEKPCYYCNDTYQGIGFDRVLNDVGYHIDNVVPCCPDCNRMKRSQTKEEFINRCVKVAKTMGYL